MELNRENTVNPDQVQIKPDLELIIKQEPQEEEEFTVVTVKSEDCDKEEEEEYVSEQGEVSDSDRSRDGKFELRFRRLVVEQRATGSKLD